MSQFVIKKNLENIPNTNDVDQNETGGTKRRDRSVEIQTESIVVLGVHNTNSEGPSRQRIEGDRQKKGM